MLASAIGMPVLFAVLMWLASAAGEISIPGTPVPITLQTFVMMLAGLMLSWRQAGSAVVLYLAAGAAGLPVLAGGASTAALFGPSAGCLIGFLPAGIVTALLRGKARLDSAPHAALTAVRYIGASLAGNLVVLYLFGNSIIATDMFTNLLTTNPEEAGELLSNIYPSIIIVCAIYLPLLWFASRDIGQRHCLSKTARMNIALIGLSYFILGGLFLAPAYKVSEDKRVLKTDIFPVNVFYNIGLCGSEFRKMYRFEHTSEDFTYHARRTAEASKREIYVYVIGEASRAANWQLYGYHRETNPCLTRTEGLVVFRNTVTQSNTTHKSVPLILSSVKTDQHEELYRRKGLPALFKETGFKTWYLSNQRPQGAMIDKLAKDADSLVYLP